MSNGEVAAIRRCQPSGEGVGTSRCALRRDCEALSLVLSDCTCRDCSVDSGTHGLLKFRWHRAQRARKLVNGPSTTFAICLALDGVVNL